jgi:signal transduction histidine kinase/ActR/RegA family two-component response regulator
MKQRFSGVNRIIALAAVVLAGFVCWQTLTYETPRQTELLQALQTNVRAYEYHILETLSALLLEDWTACLQAKDEADAHAEHVEQLFALLQRGGWVKGSITEPVSPLKSAEAQKCLKDAYAAWLEIKRFAVRTLRADTQTLSSNTFLHELSLLEQKLSRLLSQAVQAESAFATRQNQRFIWLSWASLGLLALVALLLQNTLRMHRQSEAMRLAAERRLTISQLLSQLKPLQERLNNALAYLCRAHQTSIASISLSAECADEPLTLRVGDDTGVAHAEGEEFLIRVQAQSVGVLRVRFVKSPTPELREEIEAIVSMIGLVILQESAQRQAHKLAQAKSEFLAKMSHEIRTPLNGVIAAADLMAATQLNDEQHELLDTLRLSAKTLLGIINDILDFSKIEAGRMVLETLPFTPTVLVEEVVSIMAPAAHSKGLTVRTELSSSLPHSVAGDPLRLRQILLNFVGNAIKFTARGEVVIRAMRLKKGEGQSAWLRFEVQDTGVGIPPEKQAGIFDAFTQADSSVTRQYGGTGLGLAICKRLVELMGGQIGVYSQPGQGSCFWFEVPLPVIQENAPEETTAQPSGSALNSHELDGVRVLLVEDNPVNQKVAIRMLQKLGCVVELAENGQQALEKLERASYDIVLMDMQMPVMDGLTATRLLRQREQQTGHHQVVIALTANAMQTDRELCLDAGMDDYLSKPLTLDALQVMLLRWVAQHKQRAA